MSEIITSNIKDVIDKCNTTPYSMTNTDKYFNYRIEPSFPLLDTGLTYQYYLLKRELNPSKSIPLVISVGISTNSLCNNLVILNNNIDKIKDKYSEIIFIYSDGKKIEKEFKEILKSKNDSLTIFEMGDIMKKEMASHYDKIIRSIMIEKSYEQIDYLGVSFSGGIGIFLKQLVLPIRQLILVAPAITEGFKNILGEETSKIILVWSKQDKKVPFDPTGLEFEEELTSYSNKEIVFIDTKYDETDKLIDDKTHRLQDELFDKI